MKLATLLITNPSGFDCRDRPLSAGMPLPAGAVRAVGELCLVDQDDRPVDCSARILSRWPDGCARWVLVDALVSVDAGRRLALHARPVKRPSDRPAAETLGPPVADGAADSLPLDRFDPAGIGFHLAPETGQLLATAASLGSEEGAIDEPYLELLGRDGAALALEVLARRWVRWRTGHFAVLETLGEYRLEPDARAMRVTVTQTVFAGSAPSRVEITLHNPNAASHPGGIWDLGDPGSLRFGACALVLQTSADAKIRWQLNAGESWRKLRTGQISVRQAGSGGENWDSPAHVDERGRTTPAFRGYRVTDGTRVIDTGNRCRPALRVDSDVSRTTIRPERFWQCFPKGLSVLGTECRVELFPEIDGVAHELQGGESSTSVIHIGSGERTDTLDRVDHPLHVSLDRALTFGSGTLSDWHDEAADADYSSLLDEGLNGDKSFFAKREIADEYGWRHFGELYADHETWNQSPRGIFVSHYNNQYDPVFGFARQYLQTGDPRWFELMGDLARHVLDIDLYRTEDDRPEYNHGLFWHTDHYVQAHTATHRTYSRHQRSGRHEPTGGGPGGQHCYTSGLRLYHQLTGDDRARQAVFDMARWIGIVYEGSGSMLDRARASLKSDLPVLVKLLGGRKVLRYRYPFDRGTGNYIRALLDCFELDDERHHLDRIGAIVRDTIGPEDDIEERNLGDIEGTWFYTVFLQSMVTFLDAKRRNGELDADFHYARGALLHYARWMLANEKPYLCSADKLEFVNDTWVAQDARKASVLHAAYRYAIDDREEFLVRATYFKNYVIEQLKRSHTVHYTRIQAILLQNHDPVGCRWSVRPPCVTELPPDRENVSSHATVRSHANRFAADWWRCLRTFSLSREAAWLRHRFPRSQRQDA